MTLKTVKDAFIAERILEFIDNEDNGLSREELMQYFSENGKPYISKDKVMNILDKLITLGLIIES